MLVLLLYHGTRAFDSESWHLKSPEMSRALELFGYTLTPWRLSLLFLISGAGTWFALRTRTPGAYLRDRLQRLLLPLGVGMVVVIPPQVYVERVNAWMPNRMSPATFEGSFLAFLPHIFDGVYPRGNFSWHHLWFFLYLFLYSVVALPLFVWLKTEAGRAACHRAVEYFAGGARLFLLALPLCVIHVTMQGRFPLTNALIGDWWNLTHYFALFIVGYVLLPDPRIATAAARHRRVAITAALLLTAVRLTAIAAFGPTTPYSPRYVAMLTLRGLLEWCALVGLLGYARVYLDRPWRWLAWAGERVPPFYIWHQTVLVVIGVGIVRWHTGLAVKFTALVVLALIITLAICELAGRTTPTRIAFGMRPR